MSNANRTEDTAELLALAGVTAADVAAYEGQDMHSNPRHHAMMCGLAEMLGAIDSCRTAERWSRWVGEWRTAVLACTSARAAKVAA